MIHANEHYAYTQEQGSPVYKVRAVKKSLKRTKAIRRFVITEKAPTSTTTPEFRKPMPCISRDFSWFSRGLLRDCESSDGPFSSCTVESLLWTVF